MRRTLTPEETEAFRMLEGMANDIAEHIGAMITATLGAAIPDETKARLLKRLFEPEFKGLAYLLHPQEEWIGGDSSDPKNFVVRNPHIDRA